MLREDLHQHTQNKSTNTNNTLRVGSEAVKFALGDKYEILEEIGHGGMATVYKALEKGQNRYVAIKVLHQNLVHDKEFVSRFQRESQLCSWLNHPNIIPVYDYGHVSGVYFIAMQYLEGSTLQAIIDHKKSLSLQETCEYLVPIAQALGHAHARGIIHRDIKSSNIFITRENLPVLLDFGIARSNDSTNLTKTGAVFGTPDYLSPEQVEGKTVDHRTDVYSLGVVFYQSLTGRLPFKSENMHTTLYKIVQQEPVKPSEINQEIYTGLDYFILKSLNKVPNKRFLTVIDFLDDLNFWLRELEKLEKRPQPKILNQEAEMTGLTLLRNALAGRFKVYNFMSAKAGNWTRFVNNPVVKAYDLNNEALVALKIRDGFMCQFPEFCDVLLKEASKWQKLNHHNIVKIYEESDLGGIYYLAMEYLHGKSLREYILEHGPLGIKETIEILLPALNAVHFLHGRGVQHRRILAKNIFITSDGRIVILDYGISHAAQACNITLKYEANNFCVSDISGFGSIMIQCLSGFQWFSPKWDLENRPIDMLIEPDIEEHYNDFVKQFNSPQWLKDILFKAIFRKDKSSYTSISEMIHDLEHGLNHL